MPTGFIFQQDGESAHTALNAVQRAELAAGQLSRFHQKRPVASKFAEYKSSGLSRMECNVGGLPQLKSKPKTSAELKKAPQVIWGNLPQRPIDKAVKDFSNKATGGWCCSLELAVDISNIHSDNGILTSNHYFIQLIVLFQRCY